MTEQRIAAIAMIVAVLLGMVGCTPRVRVISNPGPADQGIRYYRPKPYLKVVPAEVQVAKDASRIEPGLVSITLEYLPDFSEEYAIDVRPGLGIADVAIKLEDGWNLTEISQELDSQTDENVSAAGDLIKAVAGFVPTASQSDQSTPRFTVPATDVPLGYYESVIGCGPDGRKRLYGFRYLGFLPYQTCPTTMGGSERYCCGDPAAPLYGLTFDQGRMVFKPLVAMQANEQQPAGAPNGIMATAVDSANYPLLSRQTSIGVELATDQQRQLLAAQLEGELLSLLRGQFPAVDRVTVNWRLGDGVPAMQVEVFASSTAADPMIQRSAIDALSHMSQGGFLFDVQIR